MRDKGDAIASVCNALVAGMSESASTILREEYPFAPEAVTQRQYGLVDCTKVFWRDGFIDRYSGDRLIFPPVLRAISLAMPSEFPYHPNWKTDVTHPAFWEISATVDHLVPVSRGGADDDSNWVTTSMARNSAKMNWTVEQLGWKLHPQGNTDAWDGMLGWFIDYITAHPECLKVRSIRNWHQAVKRSGVVE